MKWEWEFQANAFCDSYYTEAEKKKYWITHKWMIRKSPAHCTYWSIWYGTKSYQWEVITYDEAIRRKKADLRRRDKLITSKCLTDNQRIATVDFMYQHGVNSSKMTYKANNCQKTQLFFTIAWWRDEYKRQQKWWMVKREQARLNIFYK